MPVTEMLTNQKDCVKEKSCIILKGHWCFQVWIKPQKWLERKITRRKKKNTKMKQKLAIKLDGFLLFY